MNSSNAGSTAVPRKRRWWRIVAALFLLLLLAATVLVAILRRHFPPELVRDVRDGIAARHIANPDARLHRYLELRYGPLSNPTNREKVFLDFFNVEHIKAMQLMVRHSPPAQRKANIQAMSQWVEHYRESLTPAESASLRAQLESPEGRAKLKRATAQYNAQDVEYRGQTAPVISQLLKTIYAVEHP